MIRSLLRIHFIRQLQNHNIRWLENQLLPEKESESV